MWKLVVDNDAKYTARPGVRIVTNFVMRSRARLRRGEGTPPYRLFFMSVTHHKYSVGNGLDRSGVSCLYPIIEFTTGPVRGVGGRCPLQIKYYAITFLGTLVLFFIYAYHTHSSLNTYLSSRSKASCTRVRGSARFMRMAQGPWNIRPSCQATPTFQPAFSTSAMVFP